MASGRAAGFVSLIPVAAAEEAARCTYSEAVALVAMGAKTDGNDKLPKLVTEKGSSQRECMGNENAGPGYRPRAAK
jgi:hypothetical protein